MEKYIFMISENTLPPKFGKAIYVRASEGEIRKRMYAGGFLRFLSSCYDYSKNYTRGTKCNGQKILSLREFDRLSDHFINESEESESAKNNGFSVEHYKNVLTAEYWGAGVPRTFEFSGRKVKIYPPKNNGDLWTVIDYEDILNTVDKMSLQSVAEFLSELSAK